VTATVQALAHYPIKGCAATPVQRAEVGTTGIHGDRLLMLVDAETGGFLSQRKVPELAVIAPTLDGARLVVSAPGADDAEIDVQHDGDRRDISLFNRWFGIGIDQGDQAAKWFTAVLDRPCRLVRVPPEHDRDGWGEHPGKVGFADAHAMLVTSLSSLDGLNERILEHGGLPVPMNRFRPNLVVGGWPEPHTEDRVWKLTAGTVELGYSTRAIRCAVPTVEQETGRKDGPEPTRTLASYRREPDYNNGVSFGAKFAVLRGGTVSVGDEITCEFQR
jgi:uncharacterized protein YcbX